MSAQQQQRVVITGLGIVSSLGQDAQEHYDKLRRGNSGNTIRRDWSEPEMALEYYFPCPEFDIKGAFPGLKPPFPLRYSQLAMMGCLKAVRDAGIEDLDLPRDRVGMILNTTFAANEAVDAYLRKLYGQGPRKASPFTFTKTVVNCALGDITRYFKFRGPSSILLGENSVCYGLDLLRDDEAEIMICGGFDELRDVNVLSYREGGVLPTPNTEGPAAAHENLVDHLQREMTNDQTVVGEGSAFVVLEKLEHALARGAKIYAEVKNYATVRDAACEDWVCQRNADDFAYAMNESLRYSNLKTSEVDCVVGSAGLPWQAQEQEVTAVASVLNNPSVHYTMTKSLTGETFGASGTMALATAAMMLDRDEVVGTGLPTDLFGAANDKVVIREKTTRPASPLRHVLVNSIHTGGNTTSVVLARA
ncbi:MAG: beta-ketoacyl synthase N-terminal-like domain-containing protein [Bacteroidota bacterium]